MNDMSIKVLVACIVLLSGCLIANEESMNSSRVFYVDSATGDDANEGTIRSKAWASLDKVNSIVFQPGDKILFRAGTVYTGQLKPKGSGHENAPIIIDMYGVGSKPRIDGKGLYIDTVLLENIEYWEVNNLEITNLAPERMKWQTGVKVFSNGFGTMHHIELRNLYIHDVNGHLEKSAEGCGIFALSDGRKPSRFDGLIVEDCHVVRTDRNGICMRSEFTDRSQNWFPSVNVEIRGNLVEDCGGDGIKPWGVDGCLVEYNTVNGARMRCSDFAAGIWPWSADNTVIQYNEACHVKGTKDGQGFDSDYNCRNTIFQYNYSHDNDGGFMLVCTMPVTQENCGNINTIIRYNISQNDADVKDSRIFHITGQLDGTYIYNNIIYAKKDIDTSLFLFGNWGNKFPKKTQIFNNIFYIKGNVNYVSKKKEASAVKLDPDFLKAHDVVFSNNVYYGNHIDPPHDPHAITDDPMLINPGSGGMGITSLDGYKLKSGSPCIGEGKPIDNPGSFDYWGHKLKTSQPSIGAYEASD